MKLYIKNSNGQLEETTLMQILKKALDKAGFNTYKNGKL